MEYNKYVAVFTEKINLISGIEGAILAAFFGDYWFFFIGFFILNVVDFLTGWYKARKTETESSSKGADGIVKKVGYWVIIGIAFFVSVTCTKLGEMIGIDLSFLQVVGYFTLATYVVNEIRSITENLVVIWVNVPKFLIKGLDITQKLLDEKTGGGKDE